MYYVMFNSIPGLHLLDTNRTTTPLAVKNEKVSRQMSSGGESRR